jgi:hypothetical protein
MTASGSRSAHANAILGPKLAARLPTLRILLVGAGGIGCELREYHWIRGSRTFPTDASHSVKNLVLTGFGDITLLDLDTIDLSNLNRQFLFRKKDVKNSKALVSRVFHLSLRLDREHLTRVLIYLPCSGRRCNGWRFQPVREDHAYPRQHQGVAVRRAMVPILRDRFECTRQPRCVYFVSYSFRRYLISC